MASSKIVGLTNSNTEIDLLSKADEIEFFERVRQHVINYPGDVFLKSLFTDSFCEWVEAQIHDDVSPDVWAFWQQARGDYVEMSHTLADAHKGLEAQRQMYRDEMLQVKASAQMREEEMTRELSECQRALVDGNAVIDSMTGAYGKVSSALDEANREIERLDQEVMRLKAEIYDLRRDLDK